MSTIYPEEIKQRAKDLRTKGLSYTEIQSLLQREIPKGTFNSWFKKITLSNNAKRRIADKIRERGLKGLSIAWEINHDKRINFLEAIRHKVEVESTSINKQTAKMILSMLYLGDGGKTQELFRFSNADPKVIELFLTLLREAYSIEEGRLRGKVQCRADQNVKELEQYWSIITKIPLNQFHKAQIDNRTLGKPTKRMDYKGVFVIIYCSKALFFEVKFLSDIIYDRVVVR